MDPLPPSVREYINEPRIAKDYDLYFSRTDLFKHDTEVLDTVLREPGRLLDLGFGTGRHLTHFAQRGFQVTGVDLSTHMFDITREKLSELGLNAVLIQSNICDLSSISDASQEYAICMFSTIGMVRGRVNREKVLNEVYRVLETQGLFVLHVHNRLHSVKCSGERLWLLGAYAKSLFGDNELGDKVLDGYRGIRSMYLHTFSIREIKKLLTGAGFRIERVFFLNEERNGELKGIAKSIRANGFILVSSKT